MKKPILLSVFVLAAAGLLGAPGAMANCDAQSCKGPIQRLYLDSNTLHIGMGDLRPLKCTPVGGGKVRYITVPVTHPVFREWNGMLLGAFLSGRPVWLRMTTSGPCRVQYLVMDK